jgi:hypothetical protein
MMVVDVMALFSSQMCKCATHNPEFMPSGDDTSWCVVEGDGEADEVVEGGRRTVGTYCNFLPLSHVASNSGASSCYMNPKTIVTMTLRVGKAVGKLVTVAVAAGRLCYVIMPVAPMVLRTLATAAVHAS